MKITVLEKCYTGTIGNMFAGKNYEVPDNVAEKLIKQGLAKEFKTAKKKTDRAVKDLSTPEE